ncbi:MAG TPA: type II secretion system F family protein, partial [Polyangiaceae bacterium]|nr:type II secretion system F family protein [Polyangiaceae bacterium]
MAVFEYRGIQAATGKAVHGVRDADNAKSLRATLKREGVLLTGAHEEQKARRANGKSLEAAPLFRRVSPTDVAMMTRQLATLVNAGIPLVESVGALIEQMEKLELKRVLTQVVDRLNEGSSLAKALEAHSNVFSNLYVSMVAAGEASGTLEGVLERLADFMESQSKLRGKVAAALAYPALMVVIGSALITVMMVVVVPKVTAIYESLDRALPWYTQALIGTSHLVSSNQMLGCVVALVTFSFTRGALSDYKPAERARHMLFVVGALVAGGFLVLCAVLVESVGAYLLGVVLGIAGALAIGRVLTWVATPDGRAAKDGFVLKLPIFGG